MGGHGRSVGGHRGSVWGPGVLGLTLQQEGGGHYDKKTTRQLGLEPVSSEGVQEELH